MLKLLIAIQQRSAIVGKPNPFSPITNILIARCNANIQTRVRRTFRAENIKPENQLVDFTSQNHDIPRRENLN
jgi:hypothetical protein